MSINIKELREFLGVIRYYRKFVRCYSHINKPLIKLLNKNNFDWNEIARNSFNQLK